MEGIVIDLRRAARRLRRSPGFTAVTVITLALGIGASTAILSAVRPVLLDALPYPGADRLVVIADAGGTAGAAIDVTFGTFREVVARSRSLQWGAVVRGWQPTLTGFGQAERLDGQSVTADYFRALGVSPALGRNFSAADDDPAAARVAIISDRLWRQHFGADRSLIGRPVTLDGAAVTLIGVMPPAFENVWNPEARIWRPLGYDRSLPLEGREWGHHLQFLARITPDASIATATRELASIARSPVASMPRPASASLNGGFVVTPLQDLITTPTKPALRAVMMATVLLLLIAVVNVVHLTLARGAERRSELATCAAFGASRMRLLTPLLAEGMVLASVGGTLGVALAYGMVRALVTMDGFTLPRLEAIHVDRTALAFAAVLSAGIGLAAGCVPALSLWSRIVAPAAGRRIVTGHQRLRRGFVVAEVSLALVLLVGAGLLLRTVNRLLAVPVGFRAENVLTLQIQVAGPQFRGPDAIRRYFERVRSAVADVPGVASAAVSSQVPLTGDADVYGVGTRADNALPPSADRSAFRYAVSPGYLATMGIPLHAGRDLDERDRTGGTPVALISEAFARRRFPGRSAIGEQIRIGGADVRFTVVGITGDVRQASLITAPSEAVYVPEPQWHFADQVMWVVLRTTVDPLTLEPVVRRAVTAIDPNQPIARVATLEQRVRGAMALQRFVMTAFGGFAAVALLLATIGIYGILAGGVVERTREIAVRAAVGASRGAIIRLIARQALVVAAIGIGVGGAAAAALSRTLAGVVFEVSLLDRATYASVGGLLLLAAAIGATVPAWRAARIAPAIALQSE